MWTTFTLPRRRLSRPAYLVFFLLSCFLAGVALIREKTTQVPLVHPADGLGTHALKQSVLETSHHSPSTSRPRAYSSTTWSEYTTSLNSDTYHASGLLEVNLNATLEHPIHLLIERSRLIWEGKLAKQSKTLKDAVTEYKQRHSGRAPPLGFEKWWKYAKEHNVQLLDEYDQIWRDVEPFWGFDTTALSVSQNEYLQKVYVEDSGVYVIGKDNWEDTIDVYRLSSDSTDPNNAYELSSATWGGTALINQLRDAGVEEHIPPFRIIVNPDDRPIIQRDWALWDRAVRSARIGSVLPRALAEAPTFGQGWLSSCDPYNSAAWYTQIDYTEIPAMRNNPKTFIHDHSPAMDPCTHPHLFRTHGQFLSFDSGRGPNLPQYDSVLLGAEEELGWVGVVSYSPTKLHADITAAIPYDWEEDAEDLDLGDGWEWSFEEGDTSQPQTAEGEGAKEDAARLTADSEEAQNIINSKPSGEPLRWALKVDERLHWRGSNTGMWHGEGMDWNLAHRLKMMDMLQVVDPDRGLTPQGFPEPIQYPEKLPVLSADNGRNIVTVDRVPWINSSMDVSFAGSPTACSITGGVCDELTRRYQWGAGVSREAVGRHRKYFLDIDGNAWSSRFKRLISTGSVVFKATVYPEWFTDRIQPWVHYVPLQVDLSDLGDTFSFFQANGHDPLAREIGNNGWNWSRSFWRKEDMAAYNFRLFLEYARAMNPDREQMSYVYDPAHEVSE